MSSRNNPPAVASTGCTGLLFSLSRRRVPQQPLPPPPRRNAETTAERLQRLTEQVDRLRLQLLEEELESLSKLLLLDHHQEHESEKEMMALPAPVLRRLEDGSYLHEVRRTGRPWERLAVQVSRPVVHAVAASASEVLDKMTAMGADNLCRYLNQRMPLKDITGRNNPGEPVRRTTARPSSRSGDNDHDDDVLVLEAMDKLESLVLEGLKIQSTDPTAAVVGRRRRERDDEAAVGNDGKGCYRVLVVLMKARDPTQRYAAVGDSMIGLVEAPSLDHHPERRKDATVTVTPRLRVQGLHVAGIKSMDRKPSGGRLMLWSAYLRQCNEPHDGGGDGCRRCTCVRNPNRVFQR